MHCSRGAKALVPAGSSRRQQGNQTSASRTAASLTTAALRPLRASVVLVTSHQSQPRHLAGIRTPSLTAAELTMGASNATISLTFSRCRSAPRRRTSGEPTGAVPRSSTPTSTLPKTPPNRSTTSRKSTRCATVSEVARKLHGRPY